MSVETKAPDMSPQQFSDAISMLDFQINCVGGGLLLDFNPADERADLIREYPDLATQYRLGEEMAEDALAAAPAHPLPGMASEWLRRDNATWRRFMAAQQLSAVIRYRGNPPYNL